MGLILIIILSLVAAAIFIPILKVASGKKTVQEIYENQKKKRDRRTARRETKASVEKFLADNPDATRQEKFAFAQSLGMYDFGDRK